jgi:hypothetical protein
VSRQTPTLVLFSTCAIIFAKSVNDEPMMFPAPALYTENHAHRVISHASGWCGAGKFTIFSSTTVIYLVALCALFMHAAMRDMEISGVVAPTVDPGL